MNRNITLIISAVTVLILLCIWLYLMFFSNQTNTDLGPIEGSGSFAELGQVGNDASRLGDGDVRQGEGEGTNNDDEMMGEDYNPDILRQLTTRNVIGYREVTIASTTHVVFMESGVGHVYSINLETGVEERVSATTVPDARHAVFSSDGAMVAVKTGTNNGVNPILLGEIDYEEKTLSVDQVDEEVGEMTFTEDNNLIYTTITNNSVLGNVFNIKNETTAVIFDTLFREATVILGSTVAGPHYFFPKTNYTFEGFVYRVDEGRLTRLPVDGFGFTANMFGNTILASYRDKSDLVTIIYDQASEEKAELDVALLPDKCVGSDENIYCAIPKNETLRYDSINKWYQGVDLFTDSLWLVGEDGEELIDITNHSGRNVDVVNGEIGEISSDWYFQNKGDHSLWIYELSEIADITE